MTEKAPSASENPPAFRGFGPLAPAAAVLGGIACLWALAGVGLGLTSPDGVSSAGFLFGFELATIGAGLCVLLLGVGKLRSAPAVNVASLAMVLFVGGVLISRSTPELHGMSTRPWLTFRVGLAGLAGLLALAFALRLHQKPAEAIRRLVLPAVSGALLIGLGAGFMKFGLDALRNAGGLVQVVSALAIGALAIALASAATHWSITAFQAARLDPPDLSPRERS